MITTSVLVILLGFPGLPSSSQGIAQARYASAASYVQSVSYGQQALAVTVTPALTAAIPQTCDQDVTQILARSLATDAGYQPDAYDTVVYLMPPCIGKTGASTVKGIHPGQMNSWLWGDQLSLVLHELGHTLGFMHAGMLDCGKTVINITGQQCSHNETGGWLSAMAGYLVSVGQYSAFERTLAGWMTPAVVPEALGSYTYQLRPIETEGHAIRVTRQDGWEYWIEWRQPIAEDSYLAGSAYASQINGVSVWQAATTSTSEVNRRNSQKQLDMSPDGKITGAVMGALNVVKTYDDILNRIRIKTVSQVNGLLTVTVTRY